MRSSISSWAFALALVAAGGWSATSMAQLGGVSDAAGDAAGSAQEAAGDIGGQADQVTPEVPNSPPAPSQSPTQGPQAPSPTQVPEGAQDTTDGAIQEGRSALDDAGQGASDALEQTEDATERTAGQAADQAHEAADQAQESAQNAADQAREGAEHAADEAREGVEGAADQAHEGIEDAAGQAQQAFEDLDTEQQAELRENAEFNDEVNQAISSDVGLNLEATAEADEEGLRVSNVQEQSLAAQAGLRQGDVIVSIDGRRFNDNRGFNEYLWRNGYNRIPIVVIRNGNRQTIWWDFYPNRWNNYFMGPGYGYGYRQGYRNGGYAQQGPQGGLGVLVVDNQGSEGGVFVQAVHQNSPAQQAGVRPGDVILAINGRSFGSTRQFVDAIRGMDPDAQVRLDILRENGQETSLTAQLSSRQQALGGQFTEEQLATREQGQRQTVLRPEYEGDETQDQQAQPQSPEYQGQDSDAQQPRSLEPDQQPSHEVEDSEEGR